MKYNTSREKMVLPEFGRNLQSMISNLSLIEDKSVRTRIAYSLVDVMASMSAAPQEGDVNHKLWDQLFIMSDYKLDVDSPYPMPTPEEIHKKPSIVSYNVNNIKYRHYGNLISALINKAKEMEDGDEKEKVIAAIASQMKKLYLTWNRDTVDDELIFSNLETISDKDLIVNPELKLASTATILGQDKRRNINNSVNNTQSKNKKQQGNSNKKKKRPQQ